ncbi:MAG: DUF2239 family protein [Gemmatimonadaceae bacterium]|nr:DUF2239 family protein [Gemmatimonadaceae bacterium]
MTNTPQTPGLPSRCTAFDGHRQLVSGSLAEAAVAVVQAMRAGSNGPLLIFDDATGRVVDIDWRGSIDEVAARYAEPPAATRGPGRPRLGVVPREVTLLPTQWDWLAQQPGGASVTLRKLVDRARRETAASSSLRVARENAYRFLHAVGGDLPDFEALSRALFAGDDAQLRTILATWPSDVQTFALQLLTPTASLSPSS